MTSSLTNYGIGLGIAALAGLGGAFSVFSGYDDAPGGVLLGWAMILGAAVLGATALGRAARPRE